MRKKNQNSQTKKRDKSGKNIIEDKRSIFWVLQKKPKQLKIKQLETLELFMNQENYYEPVSFDNFYSKNYTESESNSDRNEILLIKDLP